MVFLLELITKIENGEELPSGELKDYCHLMAVLRDSISPRCVCVLDGINWDNPPKSPEKLPDNWVEFKNLKDEGSRRYFKHKILTKSIFNGRNPKICTGNISVHI